MALSGLPELELAKSFRKDKSGQSLTFFRSQLLACKVLRTAPSNPSLLLLLLHLFKLSVHLFSVLPDIVPHLFIQFLVVI